MSEQIHMKAGETLDAPTKREDVADVIIELFEMKPLGLIKLGTLGQIMGHEKARSFIAANSTPRTHVVRAPGVIRSIEHI